MTEIEQLRHDVEKLKKVVFALAMKQPLRADENGDLIALDGPCIYEARDSNGNQPSSINAGEGRAWCRIHGFNCPHLQRP